MGTEILCRVALATMDGRKIEMHNCVSLLRNGFAKLSLVLIFVFLIACGNSKESDKSLSIDNDSDTTQSVSSSAVEISSTSARQVPENDDDTKESNNSRTGSSDSPKHQWTLPTGEIFGLYVRSDGVIYGFIELKNFQFSLGLISPDGIVLESNPILWENARDIWVACNFDDDRTPSLYSFENGDIVCATARTSLILSPDGSVERLIDRFALMAEFSFRLADRSSLSDVLLIRNSPNIDESFVYVGSNGAILNQVPIARPVISRHKPILSQNVDEQGISNWVLYDVYGNAAYSGPNLENDYPVSYWVLGTTNGSVYGLRENTDPIGNVQPDTLYKVSQGNIEIIENSLGTINGVSSIYGIVLKDLQYIPSIDSIVYITDRQIFQLDQNLELVKSIQVEGPGFVGDDGAFYRWKNGVLDKYTLPFVSVSGN
jgi:hypothetical protein